jgi:PAS domain S-box-containing protein
MKIINSHSRPGDNRRLIVAVLIPLAACGLQMFFWSAIQPYVWFLFFPAVFFSSWVGGRRGGLLATGLSTVLVWYFFIPPRFSFAIERPIALISIGMFVFMGLLFSYFHERLRQANQQVAEDQFREMFAQAAVGIAQIGLDGRWLRVNQRICDIVGYSREELLAKTFQGITHPDDLETDLALVRQILAGELPTYALEKRYVRKDQSIVPVNLTVSLVRDTSGKPKHFISVVEDITERKRSEQVLQASETRYRTLFDTLIEGFCTIEMIFDDDGKAVDYRFLETNPAFEKQTGLHNAQGRLMRDLAPNHEAHWFEIYGKVALTGEPVQFENEAKALGRHFHVCAYRVGGPQSRKVAILFSDITERKRAETALRASEERFRVAAETANDVVYEWNLKQSVQWPGKIDEMLGYEPGEFPRTLDGWAASVHPEDMERTMAAVQAHLEGRAPYAAEYRVRRKDGDYRWWWARGAATRTPDGTPVRWIGSITDITERKQAEEKIKRMVADLERSNKELEHFAYVASHDLQEPLRMVASYTQLLAQHFEGRLDDKARKYIRYSVDGAVRMQTLINDLLTYSRVGRRGKPPEPTDAHAVLGEAIGNLAAAIAETHAVITNDDLPTVQADASQLVLVFQNLLANAIKFRRADFPRVHVSARNQGGEWVFSVNDNGIGIEAKYAERVFVIFQRLHTREEYPGTGIGLAVCKRIVERHGGKIWFESAPGNGTTFFFTIPTHQKKQPTDA